MPSKSRGKTVIEVLHDDSLEALVALGESWCKDASDIILDLVWKGYDRLKDAPGVEEAVAEATDDLERGITQLLELAIHEELTTEEPFDVQHGVPEGESRMPPPARPPEYDIAFIMYGNPRIMWPVEAKVMPPLRRLSEYINTLNDRYLTCEYAPFVPEAAMAGYVIGANVDDILNQIGDALGNALEVPPKWSVRDHRTSSHTRTVPTGKPYPASFKCHHLLMEFGRSPDCHVTSHE